MLERDETVLLIVDVMRTITGWPMDAKGLLAAGMRILTLKRLINLRRGLSRADEKLPSLLMKALNGPTEGHVPDLESLIAGAYEELGWNLDTAAPRPETLEALGLEGDTAV